MNISIHDIDALVFDFDGVLTNNLVHLDQDGKEWVSCSRADGLAFDVLRKINKPAFILLTEKNTVVTARAKKLQIQALQGINNKVDALKELAEANKYNIEKILYVGNDLNDYRVMLFCGYTVCPSDSHDMIKNIASITLKSSGGSGVVRELLEKVFELNFLEILYHILYNNSKTKASLRKRGVFRPLFVLSFGMCQHPFEEDTLCFKHTYHYDL